MELLMPGTVDAILARYPETLTVNEVAAILRRKRETIVRACAAEKIPAYKVSDAWVIPRDGIRRLLLAGANKPAQALEHGEALRALDLQDDSDEDDADD
jgi:excisionase family DNA binding protein